ncbi:MAG: UDP-glucose 4-epimerase GalE [Thioalkalispiraceae bacterium]
MKTVLVTGGAGYIGSHTDIQLIEAGYQVVVVDNLCNSDPEVFNRIEQITGQRPVFIEADIADRTTLNQIFKEYPIDSVIHFAGLKAVGESVEKPLLYYKNNITGSLVLFDVMQAHGVKNIVFSSSATVYGDPHTVPIKEDFPLSVTNPYGQCKLMIENILRDIAHADPLWRVVLLRYFNPVGAHPSGMIGEDPRGIPNNLMPYVAQVAVGKLAKVNVFGGDYPTKDGTGVRDYIHVVDLAAGHLKALEFIRQNAGCNVFNLGTGTGYSVLEIIKTFEQISGKAIPFEIIERREGDIAECYADPTFSEQVLGWKAQFNLHDMIKDHWNWQHHNPVGYSKQYD